MTVFLGIGNGTHVVLQCAADVPHPELLQICDLCIWGVWLAGYMVYMYTCIQIESIERAGMRDFTSPKPLNFLDLNPNLGHM